MKKNKGLFFIVATLLAVTCLFISCSAEVNNVAGDDGVVYITFDGGNSKRITQNSITQSYELVDINELYWVYSATKADMGGASGQTNAARINSTTGLSGVIGGFSKGLWDFTLTGWKYDGSSEADPSTDIPTDSSHDHYEKIFYGSVSNVLLNVGTQSNPDPINVTVNFVPEGNGTLVIDSGFIFQWQYDSAGTSETVGNNLKLQIDVEGVANPYLYDLNRGTENNEVVYRLSDDKTEEVPAGDYVVTASVIEVLDANTTLVYSIYENINVKIYAGQTTRITAEMLEGEFAAGSFNAIIESVDTQTVTASVPVTFTSSYTPASATSGNVDASAITSVEFEANALAATGENESYKLTVAVSDFATAQSKFVVDNGTSAASLDLDLKKYTGSEAGQSITTFNENKSAVITTYIAKGLTGVNVVYNGANLDGYSVDAGYGPVTESTTIPAKEITSDSGLGYNSVTGYLSFKTNHFSEYYVSADAVEAINVRTNTVDSLINTYTDAKPGDTIMLLKDVNLTSILMIGKSLTIEGNNYSIFNTANRVIRITHPNLDVKMYNLGIISTCPDNSDTRGISFDNDADNVSLLLNNCRIDNDGTSRTSVIHYAINGVNGADNVTLTIENSTYVRGWAAINMHGNNGIINVKDSTLVGINDYSGYSNSFSTIVFDASQPWYPSNTATNNAITITNSVIVAKENSEQKQRWISFQYGAGDNNAYVSVDNSTQILSDEIDGTDKRTSIYIKGDTNHVVMPLTEEQVSELTFMYKVSTTDIAGVYDVTAYSEADANVKYSNGDFAYGEGDDELYTMLWIPFISEWIWPGEGVVLIKDIDLSGNDIIYKGGDNSTSGKLYFYFDDYSISNGKLVVYEVVEGTEIISDRGDMTAFFYADGYTTVETNNGDGTYSYTFIVQTN